MSTVTRESLAVRIEDLESRQRSIKEDFQLEAYRMLLKLLNSECTHEWLTCTVRGEPVRRQCRKCGEIEQL